MSEPKIRWRSNLHYHYGYLLKCKSSKPNKPKYHIIEFGPKSYALFSVYGEAERYGGSFKDLTSAQARAKEMEQSFLLPEKSVLRQKS